MPSIHKTAVTPHKPVQMFDLVNDLESYPLFLPGCEKVKILERNHHEVKATVYIKKGSFNKSFSTVNILDKPNTIAMKLIDGPFKYLEGCWRFESIIQNHSSFTHKQSSKISLDLEYEFQNRMMAMIAGPIITKLLESFVDSFCQRAIDVYGKNPHD